LSSDVLEIGDLTLLDAGVYTCVGKSSLQSNTTQNDTATLYITGE